MSEHSSAAPHTTVYHAYNDQSYTPLARIECTDNPLNPQRAIYYTQSSLSGLPEALTNSDGEIVWQGQYSAWGHLQRQTRPTSTFNREQNLRFQGQYFDKETGLHYNTFRYYAPDLGRFTQQDPIGLAGGINLYAYAPNPILWTDPLGLSACGVNFNKSQIQKKFKHAEDFGISGSANKQNFEAFEQAMKNHIELPTTVNISGTYRWKQDVIHYFDPKTGLNVMADKSGNFISGWKLSERQIADLVELGNVF
ncbi:RHS domain-containing protein [Proteus mirabilis]|uniref:RHS repeat-associated core domain-containing protein n=3 Tax=Proteus mirabilis TaxID=584 RepID=UPI0021D7A560|nr:RHS repeat-associated core domain-containing protein [Proteus mirabilis]MCU9588903.1 RHS domain-containing protein [Proteus mirabilis]